MCTVCIDIGAGTQDILIYNSNEKLENSIKLIYPSPTKRLANKVKNLNKDIFITGNTIGGGPVTRALIKKLKKGTHVFITEKASKTISDNPEEVTKEGFTIVEEVLNPDIYFEEVDTKLINNLLINSFENSKIDKYIVAVQDHGYTEGKSDRVTRFEFLIPFIKNGLKNAFFTERDNIDKKFTRWNSLKNELFSKSVNNFIITDTAIIATLGALYEIEKRPAITIDAGNGHTFAALINENDEVLGFFEHHTTMMDKTSIWKWLNLLQEGKINFEDIYSDGGHGAHVYSQYSFSNIPIVVTGPNRYYLFDKDDSRITFAAPIGDMMITGPVGMLIQQNLI